MSMKHNYESAFTFGDRVHIDGDKTVLAFVTGVLWHNGRHQVEIQWTAACNNQTAWVDEFRVERVR